MQEINYFAKTNFRNQERVFGIKADDRRRHMYVIGKTGMGKTNLLENMIVQDIRNGHGACYVDPHGDTAEKLLKAIPPERINDVIYFNPADQAFPIAFNVMEKVDPEYRHLVASGLIGVFNKLWADSWGPRLEYILRNAILALLEYPGSTLLGVARILVDKRYREKVVEKVTDPVVKMFWTEEFTKWNERVLQEVISPIQNKVGQFLSTSLIRNIVGQTKSSFDIRDVMDNRKILIMNLSKGRVGEDASKLMGAMMITKIQLAAMGRVDIPEEDRKDFYLYVDEFQNFATESFANILSEARKYRLNLILANQYIEQLHEEVRNAIFGNAGTLISFRVGATDAEYLEKEFEPAFYQNDIVNLPKFNIYLKLMIDGVAGDAFSATTLPPIFTGDTESNEEKIIKITRERYAYSKAEVEDKISRWSGVMDNEKMKQFVSNTAEKETRKKSTELEKKRPSLPQIQKNEINQEKGEVNKEEEKQLFDSKCDNCEVDIIVPFKPDGKRPTFCKECLKDYQRMMAKAKVENEKNEPIKRGEVKQEPKAKKPIFEAKIRPIEYGQPQQEEQKKIVQHKTFNIEEKPLKLSQMQHVAPKKFKSKRQGPRVNLEELKKVIDEAVSKKVQN